MSHFIPATTINEVILRMNGIVRDCIRQGSRSGYFAVLYRDVTIEVKNRIQEGFFDDGQRMEQLDVVFANRYLKAYHDYQYRRSISNCWENAFDAAITDKKIILQHLLIGMNAHINYDLGIATSEVAQGNELMSMKGDFEKIIRILIAMIDDVQNRIEIVSPALGWIDTLGGRNDEQLSGFAISKARSVAWLTARHLSNNSNFENIEYLKRQDKIVSLLAEKIMDPGIILSIGMNYIRSREEKNIKKVINTLMLNPLN